MLKATRRLAMAAVLAVACAVPAAAATFNVTTQGSHAFHDANGQNAWFENVSYTLNGTGRSASAGLFRLTATPAGGKATDFLAFCLEPLEYLRLPKTYVEGTPLSSGRVGLLGALVANALGLVTDSRSAAAFQIAAWEIANETSGALHIGNGAFKMTNGNSKTLQLAQSWIANLNTNIWAPNARVRILSAPGTQDLVTDLPPVPLPAAGILLLGALAGMATLRRRTA
jgi:hypothetical protein